MNAVSTAASDRSDTHRPTAVHPGISVVPAALAAAESAGCTGATLLEAIVAGYDVMGRLARAIVRPELVAIVRPTPVVGPTAGAIAASRVRGLTVPQTVAAAALATHTGAGLNEWVHAGTGEHPFHAGFAARNAVTSALLAAHGMTAAPTILEGRSGLLAACGTPDRAAALTRGLGEDFELLHVVHKPAPACYFVQAPCQAAEALVRREPILPDAIARVEITTTATAARYPGCDNAGPIDTLQDAIMSLQFSVASVLVHGRIAAPNWSGFTNRAVAALAARCRVVEDVTLTSASPRQGVGLRVELVDGRTIEHGVEDFRSMTRAEVVERFLDHASPVLGEGRAAQALDLIERLDRAPDIRALTSLLRPAT